MTKTVVSLVFVFALLAFSGPSTFAAPTNPNCWGVVVSQRASTLHDIGAHASSQATPHAGLGNVARELSSVTGGTHVSDLGSFLASVDGLDFTHCP